MALFLDDLQWLDAATLDLLEDLFTRDDLRRLLLIGAYRDNEVSATHPLVRTSMRSVKPGGRRGHRSDAPRRRPIHVNCSRTLSTANQETPFRWRT